MKRPLIQRYNKAARINHWFVAFCFILLAVSGLGFFYPSFFWLTHIFGTPQLARILHPLVGVLMFVGFFIQFFRYVRLNFLDKEDKKWLKGIGKVMQNHEVGDVGKYNAGQKLMFWLMTSCMVLLLLSGLIAWRPYFAPHFPIPVIRFALLVHSAAASLLIIGIIVHVYAALWIKGTLRAMVEGVVTQTWAEKHHPRWYRAVMEKARQSQADKADASATPPSHF